MNIDLKEKITESIKRLNDIPPSKWDMALILKIKTYLFPKIMKFVNGEEEKVDQVEVAKKIFEEGDSSSVKELSPPSTGN